MDQGNSLAACQTGNPVVLLEDIIKALVRVQDAISEEEARLCEDCRRRARSGDTIRDAVDKISSFLDAPQSQPNPPLATSAPRSSPTSPSSPTSRCTSTSPLTVSIAGENSFANPTVISPSPTSTPSPNENNNLRLKENRNEVDEESGDEVSEEDQIRSPMVLSSGSESESEHEVKVDSPTAADAADAAVDDTEEDHDRDAKFSVVAGNSSVLADSKPSSLSLTIDAPSAEAVSSQSPANHVAVETSPSVVDNASINFSIHDSISVTTIAIDSDAVVSSVHDVNAAADADAGNGQRQRQEEEADSDDDCEIIEYNPGKKDSQSTEFKPALPSDQDYVVIKQEHSELHLLRDTIESPWGDQPKEESTNPTNEVVSPPSDVVDASFRIDGSVGSPVVPVVTAVRVKSEANLGDHSDVKSLNSGSGSANLNSTVPSLITTGTCVKGELGLNPKVEVKREVNATESEGSALDDETEMVRKALPFKRHRIIAGKDILAKEAVEATLAAASKELCAIAHVLLLVKNRYAGFLHKPTDYAECRLKALSLAEIKGEVDTILQKCRMESRVQTVVQPDNDNIIKTRLFVNEVLVVVTRTKNREKEPAEDGEVKSPASDDGLAPEDLIKKSEEKRKRDLFVAFILRFIKTIYVKIDPDPNLPVDRRLNVSSDPLSLPGGIRFDALCEPRKLKEVQAWDMIQELMAQKMPKVWVKQKKQKEDEFESEFTFGRYPGDAAGEGTRSRGIEERLKRLQESRTKSEFFANNSRRDNDDSGSSQGDRSRSMKRERPSSPSVKREGRSPSSVGGRGSPTSVVGRGSQSSAGGRGSQSSLRVDRRSTSSKVASSSRRRSREREDPSRVTKEKSKRHSSPDEERKRRCSIGSGSPVASVKREKGDESSRRSDFDRERGREERREERREDRRDVRKERREERREERRDERDRGSLARQDIQQPPPPPPPPHAFPQSPSTPPPSNRPRLPSTPPPHFAQPPSSTRSPTSPPPPPPPPPSSSRKSERRESCDASFSSTRVAQGTHAPSSVSAALAAESKASKEARERESSRFLFPKVMDFNADFVPDLEKYRKRLGDDRFQSVVGDIEKKTKIYYIAVRENKKSEEELSVYRGRLENKGEWFLKALKTKLNEPSVPKAAVVASPTVPSPATPSPATPSPTAPSPAVPSRFAPTPAAPSMAAPLSAFSSPNGTFASLAPTNESLASVSLSEEDNCLFPPSVPFDANKVPMIRELLGNLRSQKERIMQDVEKALGREKKFRKDPAVQECQKCNGPIIKCPLKHPQRLRRPVVFYVDVLRSALNGKRETTAANGTLATKDKKRKKDEGSSENKRRKPKD